MCWLLLVSSKEILALVKAPQRRKAVQFKRKLSLANTSSLSAVGCYTCVSAAIESWQKRTWHFVKWKLDRQMWEAGDSASCRDIITRILSSLGKSVSPVLGSLQSCCKPFSCWAEVSQYLVWKRRVFVPLLPLLSTDPTPSSMGICSW